jgi:hypothetical protein
MATTQDFTVTKDTRIARRESDNWDAGSGTSPGLPYGLYSGYRYRALLGFSINFAGWTSITSALFYYKTSDQISVAFGSDPTMLIQRLSAAWSEGTQSGLSASNATIFPGPGAYSTNQVEEDAPTAENTWGVADITAMMRDAMAAGVFHGIRILGSTNTPGESDSAANVGEIYSREGGSDAYIRITYETNRAPNQPTIASSDVSGGLTASLTPTFVASVSDPDTGDVIDNVHWMLSTVADFSTLVEDVYHTPLSIPNTGGTDNYTPAPLTRGVTYYVRVAAGDGEVWSPISATFQFKVASLPSLTVSEPSASGRLARLTYDAGSGWGSPRMVVNWAMVCPDGGSQLNWQVQVYNDSAGAPGSMFNDSGIVGDTQSARVVPANLIEGNYYHVVVSGTCSHGLVVAASTRRVRARWGVVSHVFNMGAPTGSLALTTLSVTDETTSGAGKVVVEYATTTSAAAPGSWAGTIGSAGLNQYFWYRAWLLTWGASPAVSPTLNELRITYSTAIIVPDKWDRAPADSTITGDVSSYVYGTKSLRIKGTAGGYNVASQKIPVAPNTNYMLSARVQTSGPTNNAVIALSQSATGPDVLQSVSQVRDIEFEDPRSRIVAGPWNSGNNTSIWVRLYANSDTGGTVWFDAVKVEASSVVTPWSPGYVAQAVVLDAGGLSIDAANGGIFRLRGSNGGARDEISLGTVGLKAADIDLYTPRSRMLMLGQPGAGVDVINEAAVAQGSGAGTAGYWWRAGNGWLYGQYWGINFIGTAMMHGLNSPGLATAALVNVGIYQGDVLGTQPSVGVKVAPTGAFNPDDFKVVITSATVGGTSFELWMRSPWPWFQPEFRITHMTGQGINYWSNGHGELLQAAASAGTAYVGQPWNVDGGRGTAFPAEKATGQRFWRTDLGYEFYWTGGSWVTTQVFIQQGTPADAAMPVALTTAGGRIAFVLATGMSDIWIETLSLWFYVAGGTALSASHKWVGSTSKNGSSGSAALPGYNVDSGVSGTHRRITNAVNQALGAGYNVEVDVNMTKTGTPGSLYFGHVAQFRYIAT